MEGNYSNLQRAVEALSDSKTLTYAGISDIIKIAKRASSTFTSTLSSDDLETCMINAIYKAINKYEEGSNCKFTTYLYKGVQMECLTQKKFNIKSSVNKAHRLNNGITDNVDYEETTDMVDEINTVCEDPDIIFDRFYNNMTIKEIAQERRVCGETIRLKIKKNLKKLRKSMSEGV